jgi:hypothetical protein
MQTIMIKNTAQNNYLHWLKKNERKPHRGWNFYNSVVIGWYDWEWWDGNVINDDNELRGWVCGNCIDEVLFVDWTIVDVAWRIFDWLDVRVTTTGADVETLFWSFAVLSL